MPFTTSSGGGSFESAALLAKGLSDLGHEILAVFPSHGRSVAAFRRYNIPVEIGGAPELFPIRQKVAESFRFVYRTARAVRAAKRVLSRNVFDLVHCNDDTSFLPWAIAAHLSGIPCSWHVRTARPGLLDTVRVKLAKHVICISCFVESRFPGRHDRSVIYNPIDLDRFIPAVDKKLVRRELNLHDCEFQLICIGRDAPYKRSEMAVHLLRYLSSCGLDSRLLFLGDFSEDRQVMLRRLLPVDERGSVSFRAWVEDPERYIAASDLLVHPAEGEHFGRVFIEAEACGIPFVASASGAAVELVHEVGLSGILVSDWGRLDNEVSVEAIFRARSHAELKSDVLQQFQPTVIAERFMEAIQPRVSPAH